MMYFDQGWFSERERIYHELAQKKDLFEKMDSVFFRFHEPDAGWIGFEIFVNGKKCLSRSVSTVHDPFPDMKSWLEDIAKGLCPQHDFRIDYEGQELYFHYETLQEAEVGSTRCYTNQDRDKDTWFHFDANTYPEIGLFYVYDTNSDSIPVKAIIPTKELVTALYLAMLDLASNVYNRKYSNFEKEWYYTENEDNDGDKLGNWTFYNTVKSPLIEWFIFSSKPYRCVRPKFHNMPQIVETVHMWCDYGDALFWGRWDSDHAGCCGDMDGIDLESCGTIDIRGIEGLKEWYLEFEESPLRGEKDYDEDTPKIWLERGRELAQKVREILPDNVDLYYYEWYPTVEVKQDNEYHFPESLPMIVPNRNALE